jgi:hypothetical protein
MEKTKTRPAVHYGEYCRKELFIKLLRKKEVKKMIAIATKAREDQDVCPYCDARTEVCKASVTSLRIGALVRVNRCNSGNYDNCALFLAKCLRRSWQYSYGV